VLSKARRGELITPLPVGLAYDTAGRVVLDPDTAVQHALRHLFGTFTTTGSATACVKAFREADLSFPWRHQKGPRKGELDWKPLQHHTILRVLHNPRYAGAFTYGRYRHQKQPSGKWSSTLLPREEWISFIPDAHPGYITIEEFEANRAHLAANATAHGRDRAGGPPREGPALLQGIIICGRCGKRMTVRYNHRRGQALPIYVCQRDGIANAQRICACILGADLDRRIGQLLLETLSPLAVEAALTVSAELEQRSAEADRMRAAHVERARYQADLARRRYMAVDPTNRLVADSLEADWNTALRELNNAQETYDKARQQHTGQLTDAQHARIGQLVTDLPAIWNDPDTPARERKRIARLLLTDVTIHRDSDTITAHIRFPGGQDTTLTLPAPKPVGEQRKTPATVVAVVDELLDEHTSGRVAEILNQRGLTTGTGQPFHGKIVDNIIHTYRLHSRRQRLRAAGMLTPTEMANLLGISRHTVKAWYRAGIVSGLRYNDKGETQGRSDLGPCGLAILLGPPEGDFREVACKPAEQLLVALQRPLDQMPAHGHSELFLIGLVEGVPDNQVPREVHQLTGERAVPQF
jgi:DNA invertase Pin-like site-specific DNA recombinase